MRADYFDCNNPWEVDADELEDCERVELAVDRAMLPENAALCAKLLTDYMLQLDKAGRIPRELL